MTSRRDVIKNRSNCSYGAIPSSVTLADSAPEQDKPGAGVFWPYGVRMVISVSMQMEGGAQPISGSVSYQQSIESIERATGTRPVGFNAFWLRGTPHTLEILQSPGFIYHVDDVSRDQPFLVNVRDKPFVVVPLYTPHERHRGLWNAGLQHGHVC